MHRIDTPTAQADKFGPGKNGFTNGDPATGRRATDLNSDMWDAVQEEICAVIEKSGLALNKDQHDQLYSAIVKIITSKIPDALIRSKNLSDVVDKVVALANLNGVPKTTTVNGHALSGNTSITAQDIFNGQAIGLSTEDLDTLKTPGIYYQPANANTSAARHYPETNAGTLLVYKNAGVTQVYIVYNSSRTYTRSQYSTGAWTAWAKQYDTANKPSPSDIGAVNKGGDTMSGLLNMNAGASVSGTLTFKNGGSILAEKTGANPRNGRIYWGGDAGRGNRVEFADDAGWKAYIERHPTNGVQLVVNGRVNGSIIYSSGEVQAGGGKARLAADGNIFGSKWGNVWLDTYLARTYQPKGNYTPAGQAYTKAESNTRYVQDIRLGTEVSVPIPYNGRLPAGYVCVATSSNYGDPGNIYGCPLQKNVNGTWYTVKKI